MTARSDSDVASRTSLDDSYNALGPEFASAELIFLEAEEITPTPGSADFAEQPTILPTPQHLHLDVTTADTLTSPTWTSLEVAMDLLSAEQPKNPPRTAWEDMHSGASSVASLEVREQPGASSAAS